jgi:hypothetical protein
VSTTTTGKVDELERRYGIPAGQLRFREGVPCAGYDSGCCNIRRLSPTDCTGLVDATSVTIAGTAAEAPKPASSSTHVKGSSAAAAKSSTAAASDARRIFLCHRHNYLHMCEGDHCTAEEQICPLYAMWLVERWMDARRRRWHTMFTQGGWSVQMSGREGVTLPYWFNARTGRSLWVDEWERDEVVRASQEYNSSHHARVKQEKEAPTPVSPDLDAGAGTPRPAAATTPAVESDESRAGGYKEHQALKHEEHEARHVCTYDKCHRHGYKELDQDVWVCHVGKVPHMCTTLQCHLTRREQNGSVVCWATSKLYAAGSGEEETVRPPVLLCSGSCLCLVAQYLTLNGHGVVLRWCYKVRAWGLRGVGTA